MKLELENPASFSSALSLFFWDSFVQKYSKILLSNEIKIQKIAKNKNKIVKRFKNAEYKAVHFESKQSRKVGQCIF